MSRARDLADLGNDTANLDTVNTLYGDNVLTGRNLIINGAMNIHQRTGTISSSGAGPYSLDRFRGYSSGGGVFSMEQSTTVPNNTFTNSLKCTVTTNDTSLASGDFYALDHRVEGYNIIQTGFGTSDAVPVTLSFWVRSSVTGTYSAYIYNENGTRVYVFTYTISAADTWQKVENTFTGETTGTWNKTNGIGFLVGFNLGRGSGFDTTADAWQTTTSYALASTSSDIEWIGTSSATFYITGIQLEVGETATPFDHSESYGETLAKCHRYYQRMGEYNTNDYPVNGQGYVYGSTNIAGSLQLIKPMREGSPTVSFPNGFFAARAGSAANGQYIISSINNNQGATQGVMQFDATVPSGIQVNTIFVLTNAGNGKYVAIDAEL